MKFISIKFLSLILSASTSKSLNIDLGASELLDNSITIAKNKPLALRNLQLSMATLAASTDSDANHLRNNGRYQRGMQGGTPSTSKPTSPKPSSEPTSAKPSAISPSTGNPSTSKPTSSPKPSSKPTSAKPSSKPSTSTPSTSNPTSPKPSSKPTSAKPSSPKPSSKPTSAKPSSKPSTSTPSTSKPTSPKPSSMPTSAKPSAISPSTGNSSTSKPTSSSTSQPTFKIGDLSVRIPSLGLMVCAGMKARVIAKANQLLKLKDGTNSKIKFHSLIDAADVFPTNDGYVYVSNSEMASGRGGVYGLHFDHDGNILNYTQLLSGTSRNCGAGRTPWGTFLSCEEYSLGQCYQVDPTGQRPSRVTKLGGLGGNYESVAVDNRNPLRPLFFVTEDHHHGALIRYTPPMLTNASGSPVVNWNTLTASGGTRRYLRFLNGTHFGWTTDKVASQNSQATYYPNVEGIDFLDGHLYFVSKENYKIFVLDLNKGTYTWSYSDEGPMPGGGSFKSGPDQLYHRGEYIYLTEDGGRSAGVYAVHKLSGVKHAVFEAMFEVFSGDETTGLAFSPDGTKMYAALQDCYSSTPPSGIGSMCLTGNDCGCLFEFTRTDGQTFDGSTMGLKFHSHSSEKASASLLN